jgi:signal transduction histidine kinase
VAQDTFSVRLSNIFRSATFQLTVTYAGLFAIAAAILFAIIYQAMAGFEEQQIRKAIRAESNALISEQAIQGGTSIADEIAIRIQATGHRPFRYALIKPDGSKVGDLDLLPDSTGWTFVEKPESDLHSEPIDAHAHYYTFGAEVSGAGRLFVAQDTESLEELNETILNTFLWGGSITVGLALLGGLAASWQFLHRIERINTAAQRIMGGAISERVPKRGSRDEFDRLSGNLNAMLDRIEILLGNQKRVTSDIAHDLRTPLTRLRQDLDEAHTKATTVGDYGAAVERAIGDTDDILRTFGALLRIAEIDSGAQKSGFVAVPLSDVLQRLSETYGPVAEDSGHHLVAEIEPGIVVRGDTALLTQLFANLTENALRHTPAGTSIALRLQRQGRVLVGEVADNGPGVPDLERERVFRPFYRLDESRSTPGSGLGLALVDAIARLHDGAISLSDAGPGARFQLRMPAGAPTA